MALRANLEGGLNEAEFHMRYYSLLGPAVQTEEAPMSPSPADIPETTEGTDAGDMWMGQPVSLTTQADFFQLNRPDPETGEPKRSPIDP